MNGQKNGIISATNKGPSPSSGSTTLPTRNQQQPASQQIRRLLEPLILSLVTVLIIFHWQFAAGSTSHAHSLALDAPFMTANRAVKRRYIDPPSFDYHSKLLSSSLKKKTTSVPIFFHIYIPDNPTQRIKALQIVTSQLDSFDSNFHNKNNQKNDVAAQWADEPVTIFYQTIGTSPQQQQQRGEPKNTLMTPSVINKMCKGRKFHCYHMGHYEDGREELTLHHVQQFCKADALTSKTKHRRVMYIHNKGSHHSSIINDRWRDKMMQAVIHPKCLEPPVDVCNICSLFVTAERGIFAAGNFWVSSCDYIQQLLPPLEFEGHMERVVKDALYWQLESKLLMNMHKQWPPSFGTGRFSAEYWAGSHPDIVPCDFSLSFKPKVEAKDNTLDFLGWVNSTAAVRAPLKWTMAPKHPIKIPQKEIRNNEKRRLPEYFLLAGNIMRWQELYGRVPGEFSWVWAWFPDGRKWLSAIRLHGKHAVDEMTKGLEQEGYT